MKVAILAGGFGTRLAEETEIRPKPMVEIGGRPILWHIMKHFAHFGFDHFYIALGYKGEYIKRYMVDVCALQGHLSVDLKSGTVSRRDSETIGLDAVEPWTVELIETGQTTQTGGRIKRLLPHLGNETFMLTYGDGVSDISIPDLLRFHRSHGRLATVSAVRPPARFGKLTIEHDHVTRFAEKPQLDEGWISGGFFVLEPRVLDYIEGDETKFEVEPLDRLARDGELMAYKHESFWHCMDTLRDKFYLQELWDEQHAPWALWNLAGVAR
jgi:glucose-1-phosphate cytidylyltransferase